MSTPNDCFEQANRERDGLLGFVQNRLLCIMDFIHEVCVKENINYSLSGGTLIGAIRHKGFVPWDVDIDITMNREDYDKFASVVSDYCEKSGQFVLKRDILRVPCIQFVSEQKYEDSVVNGIQVDIFILDNLPEEEKKRRRQIFKLKTLQSIMLHKQKFRWSRFSFKKKLVLFITKILSLFRTRKGLIKSYTKHSVKYNGYPTSDKFISNDLFAVIDIVYKAEWVREVEPTQFEDRKYFVFKGYDDFLRVRYGDYMKMPPESERIPQHGLKNKNSAT